MFLAEVILNLQKLHYFGQFKDHNSGKKKEIRQMTPFFSSTFWILTVCDIHTHFSYWTLTVCDIHIKESKKTRFYFFFRLENQICLISWSTFACSRMLFCIALKLRFCNFKPILLRMQFSLVATFFSAFGYLFDFLMSF